MQYLGFDEKVLIDKGAMHTAKEIAGQPELWMKTGDIIAAEAGAIAEFLAEILPRVGRIILTGAGTSAFIGMSLKGIYQRSFGRITEVIPTTHIVSHPEDYLIAEMPTLMVSFARSGNSPESVATVMLADKHIKECYHLMITCDPRGKLALYQTLRKRYIFVLPDEANDKSLAMTGSYSAMLLAGLLICETGKIRHNLKHVNTLAQYGRNFLDTQTSLFSQLAQTGFERAVFLGSGPLFGVATESHLKLQELTDGKIICKNDSFLGFRHGPKAVIDNKTLVFYLLSNNELVRKYETDLIRSMDKGQKAMIQAGVSEACFNELSLDHFFYFSEEQACLPDEFLCVAAILPAQILGFYKSCNLGLSPDSPSVSGAISRVVEGVNIYEM